MTDPLTTTDVAALCGLSPATIRQHLQRHTMPEPDGYLGRTPWWERSTIEGWLAERPRRASQGTRPAGPGRAGRQAGPDHQPARLRGGPQPDGAPRPGQQGPSAGRPLTTTDVAALCGLSPATIRQHLQRHTMPEPDGHLGRTPWWHRQTIEGWLAERPRRAPQGARPAGPDRAGHQEEPDHQPARLSGGPSAGRAAQQPARPGWARRLAGRRASVVLRRRGPVLAACVLALAIGVLATLTSLHLARGQPGWHARPAQAAAGIGYEASLRHRAANWVAANVGRAAIIACDPLMCGALRAGALPPGNLLVLGPATPDPLGADVVVATAAVRSQFGRRLAGVYAPAVLAIMGAGADRIDIRVVAPDGAAAYLAALKADLAARRQAGAELLRNPNITASARSSEQLAAGKADSRLLLTLAALAELRPIYVAGLGGSAPGASAGQPLCWADIAAGQPDARGLHPARSAEPGGAGFRRAVLVFLDAQRPPYAAMSARLVRLSSGQAVLRIAFSAPSPLGLLTSSSPLLKATAQQASP